MFTPSVQEALEEVTKGNFYAGNYFLEYVKMHQF